MDRYIRETAQVEQFGGKVCETRLRWCGHVHILDILDKGC